MSDRLISAEKLLNNYQELCEGLACIDCPFYGLNNKCELEKMILKEQIVDAVPVVRCGDCIFFQCNMRQDGSLPRGVDEYECRRWCGSCDPTDFCSYGKRREDADK